MTRFLACLLFVSFQAHAQSPSDANAELSLAVTPPTEMTVTAPNADEVVLSVTTSGSSTAEDQIPVAAEASEAVGVGATGTAAKTVETSQKDKKESEIPVVLESTKKAVAHENPTMRIALSLLIVGAMGATAYFLVRKYKVAGGKRSEATQIKVLSQHFLGPKKSLAIVRVAGESVLIGITDHNISMIKSLSLLDEDIPEETPKEFHSIFNRKTEAPVQAKPAIVQAASEDPENRDDFSISGIKDFVSTKLKNMRSFE